MKTTFYLVATLIEHYDQPPTDTHALYADFATAKKAMRTEIEEGGKVGAYCPLSAGKN